ncbi:MAG: carbohydrate ABC transporter permease [Actinocatenispora sp.]
MRLATALRRLAVALGLVAILVVVSAFPIYWMLVSSLGKGSQFSWPPHLLPQQLGVESYLRAVRDWPLLHWTLNTLFVTVGATVLSLLVSIPAGLSVSRFRTRINRAFGGFVLVTQMIPATLLVVPMFIIFARTGLLDTLWGLLLADTAFSVPLAVWMIKGFIDSIPVDLEEAAMVDGCSRPRAFVHITVPLAVPGIVAVAVFCFLVTWGEFFFARTLVSSDDNWVLSVGLNSFQGQYVTHWSSMLAAAVLFAVPPLVFFALMQRRLVGGLTGGAVKG